MENSESRHLVYVNVYCLHSKQCLGQRALICLYPEIKDNTYVKSHNKGNTQYIWRAPDAALPGVTPGVTAQSFYSRMHSFRHLLIQIFIEKVEYARNFYYNLWSLFPLFGNTLKSAAFLEALPSLY